MQKIAIYGAGGFGKEVASIIKLINKTESIWDMVGFFDDGIEQGTQVSHFGKVLGNMTTLNEWDEPISIVFAIGSPKILKLLVEKVSNPNVSFPNIIHPEVYFADIDSLNMGIGNVIVRGCSVSVDVTIGDFNQFNSISALAHDVIVGSYNVFMPLTRISGEVSIGDRNFFAIGSVVLQNLKIGNDTKIGPGSYVMTKTKDGNLYMGNPAKRTIL
jgi:sugar O-acyltransferase (sialic acid O-acetyltransferase NeuD family)